MNGKTGRIACKSRASHASRLLCGASLGAVALVALPSVAHAQSTVYWDANGPQAGSGGTGDWNTTASNQVWSQSNSDVLGPYGPWVNDAGNPNNAIFGVTAAGTTTAVGTITLTSPITVHNMTFQTVNNWVLSGGTLTLAGTTPTISTPGATTINSVIAGTAGLTKTGTAQLFLNGTNTFSGGIALNGGSIYADDDAALGALSNSITTAASTTVRLAITAGSTNRSVTIGNAGTLIVDGVGAGSALISGAGNVSVGVGVTMSNAASTYTGTTTFGACNGVCSTSFTSIGNLSQASALGAPTTAAAGTITWGQTSQYSDYLIYLGDGDTSNRNWVFNVGSAGLFHNRGSGTLTLTGDMAVTGTIQFSAENADFAPTGVISDGTGTGHVSLVGSASGAVTLGGANTYTGTTSISGGPVNVSVLANGGVNSSLGAGTLVNLRNNGILNYTGTGASSDRTFTADNTAELRNSGTGALTLSGAMSFVANAGTDTLRFGGSYAGTSTYSGVISGAGNLASTGSTTWELTGTNTRTGTITVDGGTLRAGNASAFGTTTGATVNGGTLDLNSFNLTIPTLAGTGGQVALGAATLTVNGSSSSSYAGSISGAGDLTKAGTSTLTLTGANTYTGATTIGGGTLALNFSGAGSDIISSDSALVMRGGMLAATGASAQSNVQTFDGLTVAAGSNRISAAGTGGGTMTVALGALTYTGGLMDFALGTGGSITTSNGDGALGWATINGSDYAQVSGGNIVALTTYANKDNPADWVSGEVVSDQGNAANTPYSGTLDENVQLGGMKYTAASNSVVNLGGNTLGVNGTIIVASSVGNTSQEITGGGQLTGPAGGGTLGVVNASGTFIIRSPIVDNGGVVGFNKSGAGTVNLTAANSYTGATTLGGGTLWIGTIADGGVASTLGASSNASSNLILEGGRLLYSGISATTDRGFTLVNGGSSRTIEVSNSAADLAFTGLVVGPADAGLTKAGAGTLTLANDANSYAGATTVSGGTLSVDTLANGGVVSGIGASSAASSNLVLQTGGELQYTGGDTSIDRGFTLASGNGQIDVSQAGTTLTVSGVATGAGSFAKDGAGTLVLSGTNTYTGGTTVSAGTLRAGSAQAFGSTTGGMAVSTGATLDINGVAGVRFGTLTGAGNVTLGSATLTVGGVNSGSPGFTGTISGTGGFTKTAGGTQVMTGCNNSYTGITNINGGALSTDCILNGGLNSGVGASSSNQANLVLRDSGLLDYSAIGANQTTDRGFTLENSFGYVQVNDAGTTLTFTGVVGGAGHFIKRGAGTLVLAGANTFTGQTRVEAGRLAAGSNDAFDQGADQLLMSNVAGAVFDLNGYNATFRYLQGGGALGGNIALGSGTLTLNNPGGGPVDYAGAISGAGNLVLNSALTQLLTSCNSSYTGTTTASGGGVIQVACLANGGANSSIGAASASASNIVLNGGTLEYVGTGGSTDRLFSLAASATSRLEASGTGAIQFTNTGPITFLNADTTQSVTLGGTSTANNSLAALITNNGTGTTSLTKAEAGTWILTNSANTYTGITSINGGVLGVDKLANGGVASSLGMSSSAATNLVIGSGATLRYTGTGDATDRQFMLGIGSTTIESSGSGAVNFTNTAAVSYSGTGARVVSLGGTYAGDNLMGATIGNQNASNITSLAKSGTGRWILTGTNTYTGNTNVNQGTLVIGNGGTTGSIVSTNSIVSAGATLGFNRSDTVAFAGTISGVGAVQQIGAGTTQLTGTNTYTGGTTISDGILSLGSGGATGSIVGNVTTTGDGVLAFNRNNAVSFGGVVSGTGGVSQIGSGTTTLTGTNTYSGGTAINAGTLQVSSDANLGAASGGLSFNGGTLNTTASFTSTRATSLVGAGTILTDSGTTWRQNGVVSGAGALTKTGTGTLILAADNTYTGLTTISAGTLQVGSGSTGALVGNVVNNSALVFDRDTASTYGGSITGTGSLAQTGAGTLTLTGSSSYGGTTDVNGGGELRVAGGNTVSSGGSTLVNGATFSVDGNGSVFTTASITAQSATGVAGNVNVQNGGVLRTIAGNLTLRNAPAGPVNTSLSITGAGSLADIAGGLTMAASSSSNINSATINAGGALRTAGASLIGAAAGNTVAPVVTVSGAGSNWTSTSTLAMTNGSFSVLGGGAATFTSASFGSVSAARPASVVVSGTDSRLTTAGNLVVGSGVGTGVLTLAGGGRAVTGATFVLADGATATGILNIGAAAGDPAAAAGVLDAATLAFGPGTGELVFNHTNVDYQFATGVSGAGTIRQIAGDTNLTGNSAGFTGTTIVTGGALRVNGTLGDAASVVNVLTGGRLGGAGTIGGDVNVTDGILAPGNSPGTLTIVGDLSLTAASLLDFEFGLANAPGDPLNDVINVGGNLTLDGTINVTETAGGSFDIGLYRIFNYGGALTNNGLDIGTVPAGVDANDLFVQTSVANQVNLINANGVTLNFWDGAAGPKFDGAVNGGDGVWQNSTGNDNWTEVSGTVNAPFTDSAIAIFSAASGTVTVDDGLGAVSAGGMQFASDGYVITGDAVTLASPQSVIRVGDGSAAGAGYTATISSVLGGAGVQLVKTDLGTLVLTGVNTYTGGTLVDDGTLRISIDANLGDAAGGLVLDGATLNTTATFGSGRTVDLAGAGTFLTDAATTLTLGGVVSGAGALTKGGAGSLVLTNANTYAGGTTVAAGTLQLGDGGASGSLVGDVLNNGTLAFNRSDSLIFAGVISGTGSVNQLGAGATILTGANTYTGGTTISAGTLQLGSGGATGSIAGDVLNNGALAFNRSDAVTFGGLITGTGAVNQIGAGTTVLTGANTYGGATNVNAGTLLVNGDQAGATGLTSVAAGATLGGIGTIGGDVTMAGGATLAPGDATGPGMLAINGNLALAGATLLDYEFGQSNVVGGPLNDLVDVDGDLALAGTIDVTVAPGGSFTPGIYRVISYGGALTDSGLTLGTMPAGALVQVQTSVAGQVNLVNATGTTLNFWDGAAGPKADGFVNGGDGVWQNSTGNNNWTDATGGLNAGFSDGAFAIFSAAPGTVTVDNSLGAVSASGMQFASDGYAITGQDLTLVGPQATVRVGDGSIVGQGFTATIGTALIGNAQLIKTDLGTLVLTGTNTYTGGTAVNSGTLRIASDANLGDAAGGLSFDAGTLNTTADIASARAVTFAGAGTLLTDAGTTLTLSGVTSGAGALTKSGTGTLVLAGTGGHSGGTTVSAGTLFVNGDLSGATGLTQIDAGATFGGTGIIGGDVTLADGAILAPGANGVGTLTVGGNLALGATSLLAFEFGAASVVGGPLNDLVNVGGDLTLDGTIDVTVPATGSFGPGIYRVFNYGGALTNNGLALGAMPGGSAVAVQTAIAGQVNLVNTAGLTLSFWDGDAGPKNSGTVDGGDGTWRASGALNNWTDMNGTVNADYAQDSFAIFSAAPGLVAVDDVDGNVRASGMQFASDGYTITGDVLTLTGANATVQVGDGSAAGAGFTATVDSALAGMAQLVKTDAGTLVLTGTNTYTGGTAVNGGTLRIASDTNLGDAAGGLSFNGGTLNATADIASARAVAFTGAGTLLTDAGTTLTLSGATSGVGAMTKSGTGILVLTGSGGHTGGTVIGAGTLQLGNGGASGSLVGDVLNNSTLAFNRSDSLTFAGVISGTGSVNQLGAGATILTGANTYTGGTTIGAGMLQLGSGGTTGSIAGDVLNNGALAFNRSDAVTFGGLITGTGAVNQIGSGTTVLTGTNTYGGATNVNAGTLLVNGNQAGATGLTSVASDATLGGIGIIGGSVNVADGGTLAAGSGGVGALTIVGDLALGNTSLLAFELGQANVPGGPLNDLVSVGGNLTLDGTVNVTQSAGGSFGPGVYRMFNYAGALTDNGLTVGTLPSGAAFVQTVIANQVNLVNTAGLTLSFWDGAAGPKNNGGIEGGNGTWRIGGGNNDWTEVSGAVNADYAQDSFAIFQGTGGTVTVDNVTGNVRASGLQFTSNGYVIAGGPLTLTGAQALVRIGSGDVTDSTITTRIDAELTGSAQLVKDLAGTLVLTGTNTYTGGTAVNGGTLRIASDANLGAAAGGLSFNGGTLHTTTDITSARTVTLAGAGTLLTAAGTTLTLSGATSGAGALTKSGTGTLVLTGAGSHTGGTTVAAGTLFVNGNFANATGATTIASGATLGGTGVIGGDVSLADGATLTPGAGGTGTLAINGDLSFAAGTQLAYEFGQASTVGGALNDLVTVGGDLALDGTLNVSVPAGGNFGVGVYRVFNYGGALTNNGLTLGTLPAGSEVTVQTSITGQVNLVNAAGLTLNFWDGAAGPKNNGAINGGTGTWQNGTGNDNWTDANGLVNAPYDDGAFAIFQGTGGTVTVDNSLGQVTAAGMQFGANGYTITGGSLALTDTQSTIRVGDGSAAGSAYVATINSALGGATQLVKTDAGTLVLGGTSTYSGGTLVSGGTVQVSTDANLGAAAGDVTLNGGTLATSADMSSARDIVLIGAGTISTASGTTFTFNGLLSGTGPLTKAGAGTLLLTGDNSAYTGGTQVEGTLMVNGSLCGDVNVLAGGRLGGTGTVCTTINAGTVAPGDSIGTLTVAGDYTGTGGTLEIEAELGGDASPTDRLVVTGNTFGSTAVTVINTGGLGAQTAEGIKIVDVGGTSGGTFTLNGDYVFEGDQAVIAGAFGYRLLQNGVSTPTDGDWYLRSSLLNPAAPNEPAGPLYQPGVPLYESYAGTLQTLNRLSTLQQRVGKRQWSGVTQGGIGMWGRIEGGRLRPDAAISTSGTDVSTDTWGLQFGFDGTLAESGAGVLIAGVTGRYGKADAHVSSRFGSGEIETSGFGVGATLTWYGSGGLYADAQAQLSWFDSDLDSNVLGSLADGNNGSGEAFSLEVGQRLPLGAALSITPQAQIVYSKVRFDTFADPNAAAVSAADGDSLRGRAGLSLDHEYSWTQANGGTASNHLYGIVNLDYEMLDGTRVDVSGTSLRRRDHRLWGELGFGISHTWNDSRFTVFTEVSANTAISDFGHSNGMKGNAGFRMKF